MKTSTPPPFKVKVSVTAIRQTFRQNLLQIGKLTMKEHSNSSLQLEQNLLNRAREVQRLLAETSELPETRLAVQRRLETYRDSLESSIKLLLKRDYRIAFIGAIGIGKSTAICELLGLITPEAKERSVLETGGGGTTVCEVQVIESNAYGIETTPCTVDELRDYVQEFADYLLASIKIEIEDANSEAQPVSKEMDRALRNMSGLNKRSEKQEDGKTLKIDEAKELAKQFTSVRELTIKIMELIELHKRDCKAIQYDDNAEQKPLEWLKSNFKRINNGLHSDFSLPKLIKVIVPFELLSHQECSSVLVIDTKGIDGTAVVRGDLSCHLDDPHTLTVLCTPFNDAPAAAPKLFLENARGIPSLSSNTVLLVLPRPEEALAMKDDSGESAESIELGYELKSEQIQTALTPSKLNDLPIYFFNSREDDAAEFQSFLNGRLTAMRDNLRQQLINTIQDAKNVLANYEEDTVKQIEIEASEMLHSWVGANSGVSSYSMRIYNNLIEQMKIINAGKVRKTIRLKGKLLELDYYEYWGNGTDSLSTSLLNEKVIGFNSHCNALLNNPNLAEAKELISQANGELWRAFFELKSVVKAKSKELFISEIESFAAELWEKSEQEWGKGIVGGLRYRERVARHHNAWFAEQRRVDLEQQIYNLIVAEWKLALDKVSALLETE
ncbi:MAG: hypothetical protein RLZ75_2082 [Pseudomonadota bacterium]|jgi:hypothetical protein